jgi:hypothetical protein
LRSASRTVNPVAIILMLAGCASLAGNPKSLNDDYELSIASAALKQPNYARLLQPIDVSKSEVTVARTSNLIRR